MQNYKSGEIVELMFPFQEIVGKKVRPALIIKDYGDTIAVLKITSKHKGRKWDIELPKDAFNGLTVDSVVQADSYIEISKAEIIQITPRGTINPLQIAIVKQKVQEYLASN